MIVDKLEDTLNGGYGGLYGEVVTEDIYRLKQLTFVPDFILDIGANVGIFARYARSLFPDAWIYSVEPDLENAAHFEKFTKDEHISLFKVAIGIGEVWRHKGATNGAHESYVSNGLGYPLSGQVNGLEQTSVRSIMPDELINKLIILPLKTVAKIDCEGAENFIFDHKPSMTALKTIDYICMEIHRCALYGGELLDNVKKRVDEALKSFEETHICEYVHPMFYATKK